jgi:cytochrome c2
MRTIIAGLVVLGLAMGPQARAAPPPAFTQCIACHGESKGAAADVGPNLAGVFGRKAGSRDDFRYSRAMARSGLVWNEKNLDAFLKGPEQLVPGTRMPFEGLASESDRAAVIQHLKSLK